MKTSGQRLAYLFDSYYKKTATPQEREELFASINAGAGDDELSEAIRQAWDELHLDTPPLFSGSKTESILSNILNAPEAAPKTRKPRFLWKRFTAAAAVLVVLSYGVYQYLQPDKIAENKTTKVKPLQHDALPGGNKALLTLADGKTIILDNANNGTLAKQGTTIIDKKANGQLVYNMANTTDANAPISINTIATPRGGQYQIILPDGTKVWLNAASSLRFPTRFTGSSREVEITGEAYFEVTKNEKMPFHVKTNRAVVEVLGTHFNVMAYDDEKTMKTTLLEGAVNIKNGTAINRLKPGQQAQIYAGGATNITSDIDVEEETAWKNGMFQFNDVNVDVIFRQAARWYDLDVVYKGDVPAKKFTGRISRNVKASSLLAILNYFDIDAKIEGKNIVVK